MAGFGVEYARVAVHETPDTDAAAPTYGELMNMGPAVTANMTPNVAEGDIWGDNIQQAYASKFVSAAIPMEVTDCPKKTKAKIYGATYVEAEDGIDHNAVKDIAPYCGLAYIKNDNDGSGEYFEPHFYAKVKAAISPENAQTRNASIAFQSSTINFSASQPINRNTDWHKERRFDSFQKAVNFINECFGIDYVTLAAVEITGTPDVGETLGVNLTYSAQPDTPPTLAYQWKISDDDMTFTPIAGATNDTYVVDAADLDKFITCEVVATGSAQGTEMADSVEIIGGSVATLTGVTVTGTPNANETLGVDLTYSTPPSPAPTLAYQWKISDDDTAFTPITGETSSTYDVVAADVGKYITCEVVATGSAQGTVQADSVEIVTP